MVRAPARERPGPGWGRGAGLGPWGRAGAVGPGWGRGHPFMADVRDVAARSLTPSRRPRGRRDDGLAWAVVGRLRSARLLQGAADREVEGCRASGLVAGESGGFHAADRAVGLGVVAGHKRAPFRNARRLTITTRRGIPRAFLARRRGIRACRG